MYQFKSLGIQTNLLLDSFLAEITEKDDYFVIRTPDRPNYFWGNYILMKSKPYKGCFNEWKAIFENEIGKIERLGYCALTFDLAQNEETHVSDFLQNSFSIGQDKILTCQKVSPTEKLNSDITIKEYDLSLNVDNYIDTHQESKWDYGSIEDQKEFLNEQANAFLKIIDLGVARRFAAYFEGKMVGDLGIYKKNNIIRFNSVSTHEDYRGLGVCSTLVYEVSKKLLQNNPNAVLIMQADESYHAAKIYESIGFIEQERIISLEWKDNAKFGAQ